MKKISIIIPAYNVQNYIVRTLSSILDQNTNDIEIIVVDDGSTDQTAEVVTRAIESSSIHNITLYSKCNGGVSSARNFGLERAIGEYVYFLDGDDYVAVDFISHILCLVEEHEPQIIYWPYVLVDETGAVLSDFTYRTELISRMTGLETLNLILLENAIRIWTGSIAFQRDFLMTNKMQYTNGCVAGEDLEFIYKALTYADSVLFARNIKTYYLQRATSTMNSYSIRGFDAVLALERARDHIARFNAPKYLPLISRLNEYEIPHNYAGTFGIRLLQLLNSRQMKVTDAKNQLLSEINNLYPGLHNRMMEQIRSRMRQPIVDKLNVFQLSPLLYCYLSRVHNVISIKTINI